MTLAEGDASRPSPRRGRYRRDRMERQRRPVPYEDALAFMEQRAAAIRDGTARECVWLLEHPPLFTAGTSADPAELINPARTCRSTRPAAAGATPTTGRASASAYVLARPRTARARTSAASSTRSKQWMIDTLGRARRRGASRARAHRHLGRRRARRSQNRRYGRAREALGDASRVRAQRRSRSCAFRRHRAVRDRRIWRHQPRRTWETNPHDRG